MMWRVPGETQSNQDLFTRPVSLLDIYPDTGGSERRIKQSQNTSTVTRCCHCTQRTFRSSTFATGHLQSTTVTCRFAQKTARFIRYWDGTTELVRSEQTTHTNGRIKRTTLNLRRVENRSSRGLLPSTDEIVQPLPSRQAGAVTSKPRDPKPKREIKKRNADKPNDQIDLNRGYESEDTNSFFIDEVACRDET